MKYIMHAKPPQYLSIKHISQNINALFEFNKQPYKFHKS